MKSWNRKERNVIRCLACLYEKGKELPSAQELRERFGFSPKELETLLDRMHSSHLIVLGETTGPTPMILCALPAVVNEARALGAARAKLWLTFGLGVASGVVAIVLGGLLLQTIEGAPRNTTQHSTPPLTSKPAVNTDNGVNND